MDVRKLEREEHLKTRSVWEKIFKEDTKEFLDYYYKHITDRNEIYVVEEQGEIASMLHLNPYLMYVGVEVFPVNYIVAVATKPKFRRMGLMNEMLCKSLSDMRKSKMPFTFLMPVKEEIYLPYGFTTVSKQEHYEYDGEMLLEEFVGFPKEYQTSYAEDKDCKALAIFANHQLSKEYDVFTKRSEGYFSRLIKEQESQNGGVVLVKEEDNIVGYFITANEGYRQVREPVFAKNLDFPLTLKDQPKIMVRIVHLEILLGALKSERGAEMTLEVYDPILHENTGVYHIKQKDGKMMCKKMSDEVNRSTAFSIDEVAQMIFAKEKIGINEIV